MSRAYTLREWERLPYGEGVGQISTEHADSLAAVAQSSAFAGKNGIGVLEHGRHALRARGIVGIVTTGSCSLEILPKIDTIQQGDENQKIAATRKRLVHMLAVAMGLKLDLGASVQLDWQKETLLEILIRVFCGKLTEAVRRGMPRNYVTQEDDLLALRGQLNITRQFTHHAINPSRLACRFDTLSDDIEINRIMKSCVLHLLRLSRSPDNQRTLRELAFVYSDITEMPSSALRWDKAVIDRTNRRWQDLLNMARLFLRKQYQTTTGGGSSGTAMLFEMNTLFEEYVGRLIKRSLAGTDLSVSLQGGLRFCLTKVGIEKKLFQTKPDIIIRRGTDVTHVIDTKWKRIASHLDDPKQGVTQADVYQMMAYAQLYDAPRLTLLYPHHNGLENEEGVHTWCRINGTRSVLDTASFDVAKGGNTRERIGELLSETPPLNTEESAIREGEVV